MLEHRLVNNPHAKNVETVVGFGENSRDRAYILGTVLQNGNSKDQAYIRGAAIINESSTDRIFVSVNGGNERSRDKSYVPGAPVIYEGSKDKVYIPGAPVTPVKPCTNAAQAEAASRPYKEEAQMLHSSLNRPVSGHTEEQVLHRSACTNSQEPDLTCTENLEPGGPHPPPMLGILGGSFESEHFSTEELDSSEEDSQGSTSSKSNQGVHSVRSGESAAVRDDEDGIQSIERKRKLFSSDIDCGNGIIGSAVGKGDGRSHHSEKAPRKSVKNQVDKNLASLDCCASPLDNPIFCVRRVSDPRQPKFHPRSLIACQSAPHLKSRVLSRTFLRRPLR